MSDTRRSRRLVSLPLEIFGDKRGLLILRNMVLPGLAAVIRALLVAQFAVNNRTS